MDVLNIWTATAYAETLTGETAGLVRQYQAAGIPTIDVACGPYVVTVWLERGKLYGEY